MAYLNNHLLTTTKKTPSVLKRSPIQVLTVLNVAWLQWSDDNCLSQHAMAIGESNTKIVAYLNNHLLTTTKKKHPVYLKRSPIQV